jgi:hypothetical protein
MKSLSVDSSCGRRFEASFAPKGSTATAWCSLLPTSRPTKTAILLMSTMFIPRSVADMKCWPDLSGSKPQHPRYGWTAGRASCCSCLYQRSFINDRFPLTTPD